MCSLEAIPHILITRFTSEGVLLDGIVKEDKVVVADIAGCRTNKLLFLFVIFLFFILFYVSNNLLIWIVFMLPFSISISVFLILDFSWKYLSWFQSCSFSQSLSPTVESIRAHFIVCIGHFCYGLASKERKRENFPKQQASRWDHHLRGSSKTFQWNLKKVIIQ